MKVIFTPEAFRDIDDIGAYISQHNPVAAVTTLKQIRTRCDRIASVPAAHARFSSIPDRLVRRMVWRNYMSSTKTLAGRS